MVKAGRNAPCSCGSGKKYKTCCGSVKGSQRATVSNPANGLLSFQEVQQRLEVPSDVFNALLLSGLMGPIFNEGIPVVGVEHFERFATQWRADIGERSAPYHSLPQTPGPGGGDQPPFSYTQAQISSSPSPELADKDTGWIGQFYLRPNRYFFPDPTSLALVGPLPLRIEKTREVQGSALPTYLCPDPANSLAMVMVIGNPKPAGEPFEVAYDIVAPLLDELSVQYDQPLPIAHSFIVGIPSGVITTDFQKGPKLETIKDNDLVLLRCPYPELEDAVALYREGISSNNPFHQFLTLWKVYENACRIRGQWRSQHKCDYVKVHPEVFPDLFAFGTCKGKTFEEVKQSLNDSYRNAIAHSDYKKSKPRTGATSSDFVDVSTKAPIVRYMARIVLENVRATLASTSTQNSP